MASTKKKALAGPTSAPSPGRAGRTKKAAPKASAAPKTVGKTAGKTVAAKTVAGKTVAAGKVAAKKAAAPKTAPQAAAVRVAAAKATAPKPVKATEGRAGQTTAGKTVAARAGVGKGAKAPAVALGAKAPGKAAGPRRRGKAALEPGPGAVPGLSEEDQIRAAKYLPRELPKRLFEEDRFLFPETYGVNRVRLLVRDPEWIFAYWDVSPAAMKDLGKSLGERALALSRLTLRVLDPVSGGSSDILLPPGARWWYIRTDSARRTYRAELGVTLPSGEFRRLAESNTVVTPRVGPSPERARRRMSYRDARDLPPSAAEAAGLAERETAVADGPWTAESIDGAAAAEPGRAGRGGASDAFRPGGGPGDAPRPGGASDTFRR
jgi:hypothetical protein